MKNPTRWTAAEQAAIRRDIFGWLERREVVFGGYEFRREFLRTAYAYEATPIALMDRQNGIWNPTGFDATLSITKTLRPPYANDLDGVLQKYSYERLPGRPLVSGRNLKLRVAAASGEPLILFQEIRPSLYLPRYPVYITRDMPEEGFIEITLDETVRLFGDPLQLAPEQRRYVERMATVRMHQKSFRSRVLHAYGARCAVCSLAYPELLDAAHITPDGDPNSTTSVSNGLALCKMHHAAYDRGLIGIDSSFRIHVREDVRADTGGPMLEVSLQTMEGHTVRLPRLTEDRPDTQRLHYRFLEFTSSALRHDRAPSLNV